MNSLVRSRPRPIGNATRSQTSRHWTKSPPLCHNHHLWLPLLKYLLKTPSHEHRSCSIGYYSIRLRRRALDRTILFADVFRLYDIAVILITFRISIYYAIRMLLTVTRSPSGGELINTSR